MRISSVCVAAVVALAATACDSVTEIGEVRNPNASIERDGAASTVLNGKVVWVFGDTFTPYGGVRNSAATADPADPTKVTDQLQGGVPAQAVPFTADELAHNQAGDAGQWVIWPSSVIATGKTEAVIFSSKFNASETGWIDASLLVSRLKAGESSSTRVAEPLAAPDSNFATGPFLHGGFVYLMDCGGLNVPPQVALRLMPGLPSTNDLLGWNGTGRCRLARVPVGEVATASSYRFWTGVAWLPVSTTATPVIPGSNAGASVAWNPSWGKFVALSVPGLSKEIQVSTAPSLTGPWTEPKTVFTAETNVYAVRIHPELSPADLSTMTVSWFRQDQPGKKGGVVLAKMRLDKR